MTHPHSEEQRISEVAADWRVRHDAGLSVTEEEDFVRWLESDPRHAELFSQMDASWRMTSRADELPLSELGVPQLAHPAPVRRLLRPARWAAALSAAAGLAAIIHLLMPRASVPLLDVMQGAISTAGTIKRLDLPDGSVVRLNANTAIDVCYGARSRLVRLVKGEAHFEVAKDKARPFIVSSSGISIRAVGTAFDVSLRAQSVEVLVTEGKVTVDSADPGSAGPRVAGAHSSPPLVEAGHRIVLALDPRAPPVIALVDQTEMTEALAWQDQRLKFKSSPLSEILAAFNRFNARPLILAEDSSSLGQELFAGSFRADDPDTFLQLIQTRTNITIERRADRTILRVAR